MERWKVFDPAIWNTVHASLAPSTLKRYQGIFDLFQQYLSDVGRTVQSVETEDVLTFIQDYVDDRKASSTIRSVYSSLLFHFRLYGREDFLLQNPIIQMFVEGAQRLAPPPAKKCVVWNPEIPLSFIATRKRPQDLRSAGQEALLLLLHQGGLCFEAVKINPTASQLLPNSLSSSAENGAFRTPSDQLFRRETAFMSRGGY